MNVSSISCFNSTLVQLKVKDLEKCIYMLSSFNSTLVQLKDTANRFCNAC